MKSAAALTLGLLVTTASASQLRVNSRTQRTNRASTGMGMPLAIQALAEKYDCKSGELGLESVIDEISAKNAKTKKELETSCALALQGYDDVFSDAVTDAKFATDNAEPNAEVVRLAAVEKAETAHNKLEQEHTMT